MPDFTPPESVRIGFADFQLHPMTVQEALAVDHTGITKERELRIDYDPHAPGPLKVNTTLHEVLHACWGNGELGKKAREEKAVAVLANQLCQVFRDNPALIIRMVTALNPEAEEN